MLTWDYQLARREPDLALLNQARRLDLARAAIANVWPASLNVLGGCPSDAIKFVDAALELITRANEVRDIPIQESGKLLDNTAGWLPNTGAGVRDVSMCVITILHRAGGMLREDDVCEVLSYAYQVVLYSEILSKLERDVTEMEVRQMETANAGCMACIAAQIQLIGRAVEINADRR